MACGEGNKVMLYDLAEVKDHIVDLDRSKWDKERSDKKNGYYIFEKVPDAKVYIKSSDYEDKATRPKHVLRFVDIERMPYHRSKFGAEFVTSSDPYWPEPMVPDANDHYVIMDAVLVKISDIEGFVDFRVGEREKGLRSGYKEENKRFNQDAKSAGVGLSDSDIEKSERLKQ